MRKLRDSQRGKVYKAQAVLACYKKLGEGGLEESERYIKMVWTSPWTRRHFPEARKKGVPHLNDGRGTRSASFRRTWHVINLPRWARQHPTMLHEIAHALTYERPPHGWKWAQTYVALVQHFIGVEAGTRLKLSYRLNRVKFKPPRKMSPVQKARLAEMGRANLARLTSQPSQGEPPAGQSTSPDSSGPAPE